MSRRLEDVRLVVMMLDGIEIAERTHVVALGITTEGVKIPLGLWEGSTENATLARTLLAELVDRGLDSEQVILFVIDAGKALRRRSTTSSASTRSSIAAIGPALTAGSATSNRVAIENCSRQGLICQWLRWS